MCYSKSISPPPLLSLSLTTDMNSCLTEVMVKACVAPVLLSERFVMIHVLLVAILHNNVGSEVGKSSFQLSYSLLFLLFALLSLPPSLLLLLVHLFLFSHLSPPPYSPTSPSLPLSHPTKGAYLVQKLAQKLESLLSQPPNYGQGKECNCVVLLMANLYTFKVSPLPKTCILLLEVP